MFVLMLTHTFISETFPDWPFLLGSLSCVYTVGFENMTNHTSGFTRIYIFRIYTYSLLTENHARTFDENIVIDTQLKTLSVYERP